MEKDIFNPERQHSDLNGKIIVALERISEVFRALLWDHAKVVGLSPIQIQLLIFVDYHDADLCNVSHLAKEFNVTKPTISDAIRILLKKGLIKKEISPNDRRAYAVLLTPDGKAIVRQTEHFTQPLYRITSQLGDAEQEQFFKTLSKIIYGMDQSGLLAVQRMCLRCQYYLKKEAGHYCRLLETDLSDPELRLDCPEFTAR